MEASQIVRPVRPCAVDISRNIGRIRGSDLDDGLYREASNRLLDYFAVTIAAWNEPETSTLRRFGELLSLQGSTSNAQASVVLFPLRLLCPYAALLNGTMGHVKELDDEHHGMIGHPGVVVIPTCLAVGESNEATGREILKAIVAGYEVACRVGMAFRPGVLHERGFHPTGVCGAFGAAAAASYLLGLDEAHTVNALGIVGSMASSIFEFVFEGAQTKRLHPGWAAHSGITAALLAQAGFSGPATVFEGPFGILRAFSGEEPYNTEILHEDWGDGEWQIKQTAYNPYACCSYIYSSIDVVLDTMERYQVVADDIVSVNLRIPPAMVPIVAHPRDNKVRPRNIVDAQFSVYYCVAAAIASTEKRSEMATFEESFQRLQDAQILQIAERVTCDEERAFAETFPIQYPASCTIRTKQGNTYSSDVKTHRGDPVDDESRFSDDDLETRFFKLLKSSPLSERAAEILETARNLEIVHRDTGSSVRQLIELSRCPVPMGSRG